MNAFFTRIRVRILCIVLLAIIPAVGLIFYSAAERKRQVSDEIENNALRLSRFLASNLQRDLSEGRGFLKAGAKLVETFPGPVEDSRPLLYDLLGDSAVYINLAIADSAGNILGSARPIAQRNELKNLRWFQSIQTKPRFSVGFDFSGMLNHEASMNLAIPLEGKYAGQGAILFAVMDLEWLNTLAQNSQLPPGSALGVTNRSGDAVARYPDPDKWVGKPYPKPYLQDSGMTQEGVRVAKGIDGIRRVYAFTKVNGIGDLVVHVGIKREAIYAPANRALMNQLLALGAVGILAILAAWFASDVFLLKQVRALIAATKKLASGNMGARSSLSYDKGELGELARAFDEMAETLDWRDAQLRESEVERGNPINHLFDLIELAPEPVLILDADTMIVVGNHVAAGAFGYSAEAFTGLPFRLLFPEDQQEPAVTATLGRSSELQPARVLRARLQGRRKDGSLFPAEAAFSKSLLGNKSLIMAIFRMSEEKEPAR